MSGSRIFVDTNILLYFLERNPELKEVLVDKKIHISFITELELLCYPGISKSDEENIRQLLGLCDIINLNQEIKTITIDTRRKYKLKLPDAIIAASSYYLKIPLLTADKQFQ